MSDPQSREELLNVRRDYRDEAQLNLDKCLSYLNFYVGLISAVLGATLAGLLQVQSGDRRALLLLVGPVAAMALTRLAYQTITVFYRRFVEAWVTTHNLESLLDFGSVEGFGETDQRVVLSRAGRWTVRFERPMIEELMRTAPDAETLIVRGTAQGDTLRYARRTLLVFAGIAVVLAVACVAVGS